MEIEVPTFFYPHVNKCPYKQMFVACTIATLQNKSIAPCTKHETLHKNQSFFSGCHLHLAFTSDVQFFCCAGKEPRSLCQHVQFAVDDFSRLHETTGAGKAPTEQVAYSKVTF